jgi:hypothetical protein
MGCDDVRYSKKGGIITNSIQIKKRHHAFRFQPVQAPGWNANNGALGGGRRCRVTSLGVV